MRRVICMVLAAGLIAASAGCSMSRKGKGAIIGGTTGAVIGGVIGKQAGNTAVGAILGAAVGGTAGAIIGNYMDKQAEEMQADLEGVTVERVGEGIKLTFNSGILFDVNKSDLRPASEVNLEKLSTILSKYPDTNILIEGHTDSDGAEDYNQTLSERRAASVANFLASNGVSMPRMSAIGYGERQPVADNATVEGKQQNRRVEVAIMANEKLKKAAEEKARQGDQG